MGNKYIDPLSDGGFKIFFGKEGKSNQFLIDFLNGLFADDPEFDDIVSIEYRNTEQSPDHLLDKEIRYDIRCTTSSGHHFVVEIQRQVRPSFIKRTDYYMAKAILAQQATGTGGRKWNYNDLRPVVGVFVLESRLPGKPERPVLDYQYRDREDPSESLDMTRKIFVQLDCFRQKEDQCISKKDQWFYILKHLDDMEYMPFTQTRDSIFAKLDKYAQIANLTNDDRQEYERMLKFSLDYHTDMEDSRSEGRAEGHAEGRKEGREEQNRLLAVNFKQLGVDIATISKATGLTEAEINAL